MVGDNAVANTRDLDGFLLNVEKWRGSRPIQRMSFQERGVYFEMMLECWLRRRIPDDPQAVADLIATTPEQVQHVLEAWPVVRRSFAACEPPCGLIEHLALERTRRAQRKYRRDKQLAGKLGGEAAARNRLQRQDVTTQAKRSTATALSSDQSREEKKRRDQRGEEDQALALPAFLAFPVKSRTAPWSLSEAQVAAWVATYPSLDVRAECRKAQQWAEANPQRRKTAKGMRAFLVNWLNRSAGSGPRPVLAVSSQGQQNAAVMARVAEKYERQG